MIRLDTINRSLTLILGGAQATAPLQIVVSYSDQTSSTYLGSTQLANSNGTTAVTICSAPVASVIRDIDMVTVLNTDSASQVVTIQLLDTATVYKIITVTLLVGDKLTYTHGSAWQVVNNAGNIKYSVLSSSGVDSFSGGSTGLTPATATTGAVTLGGTLAVASGGTGTATPALVAGTNVTITGSWPNQTINAGASSGTVTSVAALTLGTTGTDVSSTVANSTTTPVITLNLPTASATNRGALSAADWTTFNNKGSGTVTSVTGTAPVVSSGGTTPAISMAAATTSTNGYLTSTDWNTFNSKGTGTVTSVSGTTGRVTSTGGTTPVIDLTSGVATAGTTGSASLIPVVTIDTYGRVTSITTAANPQGTVTSVTGTAPVVSSGGATPAISMAAATSSTNGYLTSTDWSTFNSKGSGSVTSVAATVPTFLSVTGSPITTSGTLAISYSGTALPIANGGSGEITAQLAMNAFAGAVTSGSYLRGNGTNVVMATIQAADVPTLNQNTTGTASNVTGTVAVANGGTGLTTTPANGALDIGNGTGFTRATLTAGTGISVTNASGSITIAATNSGTVTSVTGTSPVVSSGGATPAISMAAATTSVSGYLTSTDWNTFNNKGSGTVTSVSGTIGNITSTGGATPVIDLASGIATAGTTGSASLVPVVTIDTYGRVTSITTAANPQGTVTSVTGTSPIASSGGATPALSLSASYGDTQNPYASKTANYVLAAPNGTAGVPTFRAVVAADIPTLNQNTTGSAGSVANALTSGTGISFSSGTTYNGSAAITVNNSLPMVYPGAGIPNSTGTAWGTSYSTTGSGTVVALATSPSFTTPILGTPTSGNFSTGTFTWPTFNQNTTGNAATATSATTATNIAAGANLQIPYNTGSGATSFIAAPTIGSTYLQYNGTGFAWASAAGLGTVTSVAATVPSFLSITGSPITTAGTLAISYSGTALPIANGGTGQTTAGAAFNALSPITTTGDLIIGNGTNSATRLAIGANTYVLTSNGTTATWAAGGGGSGGLSWQSVQTANFTGVSGNAYPVNTTSAAITVTLPASPSAGNFLCLTDYAGTFATNNLILNPNGSKIDATTGNSYIQTTRSSIHLVYIDATQGWIPYSGFNTQTPAQSYSIDYLVVAGGAGSGGIQVGSGIAGGGGAGGYLTSTANVNIGTGYTVTIGAGGSGGAATGQVGFSGSTSSFNSTAPVGGGGGSPGRDTNIAGVSGGSGGGGGGGGGGSGTTAGSGTSGQGYAGGTGYTGPNYGSGGGGGAGAVGAAGTSAGGGNGGVGLNWQSLGTYYAGGGGGASYASGGTQGTGGSGGGGNGSNTGAGNNATANTGGGGGGTGKDNTGAVGGNGGSGTVIIRYSGSQRGTGGTVTSVGGYTYHTFTSSGTYTA